MLGGGGIAGVAWHTGVLAGLADGGVDVGAPTLAVGTSAGATVAAQVMAGRHPAALLERQQDPGGGRAELAPPVAMDELWERLAPIYGAPVDEVERRRRLGALALATATVDEDVRRAVLAARLDGADWPVKPGQVLRIVAVDAATGDRRVFDSTDGVPLVDAVTASSAVPGVWPPVTIGTSRYVDGGSGRWSTPTWPNRVGVRGSTGCWCWPRWPTRRWTVRWRPIPTGWLGRWSPRTRRRWPPSGPTSSTRRCGSPPRWPAGSRAGPRPGGWGSCWPAEAEGRHAWGRALRG